MNNLNNIIKRFPSLTSTQRAVIATRHIHKALTHIPFEHLPDYSEGAFCLGYLSSAAVADTSLNHKEFWGYGYGYKAGHNQ